AHYYVCRGLNKLPPEQRGKATSMLVNPSITPEPIDPARHTYDDGFVDGVCLALSEEMYIEVDEDTARDPTPDELEERLNRILWDAGGDGDTWYKNEGYRLVRSNDGKN